jgi:hypothetical protein
MREGQESKAQSRERQQAESEGTEEWPDEIEALNSRESDQRTGV